MEQKDQKQQPFFAKFLENQRKQSESNQMILEGLTFKLWDHNETHKYPSDSDDDWTEPS